MAGELLRARRRALKSSSRPSLPPRPGACVCVASEPQGRAALVAIWWPTTPPPCWPPSRPLSRRSLATSRSARSSSPSSSSSSFRGCRRSWGHPRRPPGASSRSRRSSWRSWGWGRARASAKMRSGSGLVHLLFVSSGSPLRSVVGRRAAWRTMRWAGGAVQSSSCCRTGLQRPPPGAPLASPLGVQGGAVAILPPEGGGATRAAHLASGASRLSPRSGALRSASKDTVLSCVPGPGNRQRCGFMDG